MLITTAPSKSWVLDRKITLVISATKTEQQNTEIAPVQEIVSDPETAPDQDQEPDHTIRQDQGQNPDQDTEVIAIK